MLRRSVLKDREEEVKRLLRNKNVGYKEIADKFGVTVWAVSHWRRKLGVARRSREITLEDKQEVKRLYLEGVGIRKIGETVKRSPMQVTVMIREMGLSGLRRKQGVLQSKLRKLEAMDYVYREGVAEWAAVKAMFRIQSLNDLDKLNFKTFTPTVGARGSRKYGAHEIYNGIAGTSIYVYTDEKKLMDFLAENIPRPTTIGNWKSLVSYLYGQGISFFGVRYLLKTLGYERKTDTRHIVQQRKGNETVISP